MIPTLPPQPACPRWKALVCRGKRSRGSLYTSRFRHPCSWHPGLPVRGSRADSEFLSCSLEDMQLLHRGGSDSSTSATTKSQGYTRVFQNGPSSYRSRRSIAEAEQCRNREQQRPDDVSRAMVFSIRAAKLGALVLLLQQLMAWNSSFGFAQNQPKLILDRSKSAEALFGIRK